MDHNSNKLSVAYRAWHWLNGIAILGLMGTVALRKTFLSWRTNSAVIQSKLESFNVTAEAAKSTAKAIRAPMWEWHYVFGFIAIGTLIVRLIQVLTKKDTHLLQKQNTPATKLKKVAYLSFYGMMAVMSITGIALYTPDTFSLSKDFTHEIKEFHEALLWFFPVFTTLHLAGVFVAELNDEPGIISKMIHGRKASASVSEEKELIKEQA